MEDGRGNDGVVVLKDENHGEGEGHGQAEESRAAPLPPEEDAVRRDIHRSHGRKTLPPSHEDVSSPSPSQGSYRFRSAAVSGRPATSRAVSTRASIPRGCTRTDQSPPPVATKRPPGLNATA